MKTVCAIDIRKLSDMIDKKVIIVRGVSIDCKKVLGVTKNLSRVIFDDWDEVSSLDISDGMVKIFDFNKVQDLLMSK